MLGVVERHEDKSKTTKKSLFKKKVTIDEVTTATHQGSSIVAGGNVNLNAVQSQSSLQLFNSGDVLLEGTHIQAAGDVTAYAGGEMNVVSGEEWQSETHIKKKSYLGGLFGSSSTSEEDVQFLGHTEMAAGGDVTLLARNDINVLAGDISASNITAEAGFGNEAANDADINILGDTETKSLYQASRRNGVALDFSDNFLSVAKETAQKDSTVQTTYVGSTFVAQDNLALAASRDVNVVGSQLRAGQDLALSAGRDVNLLAGMGSQSNVSQHSESKTGINVSGDDNGVTAFAGDDTQQDSLTNTSNLIAASVLSAGNNVSINAGKDITIQGSDVQAGKSLNLTAVQNINILAAQNNQGLQQDSENTRDGLTVSANHNLGATADALANVGQGENATSQASSVMQAADALNNAGPNASAHVGQTTTGNTDSQDNVLARVSTLGAGQDINLAAGKDVLLEGTQVNAGRDIGINAQNISVVSAQDVLNNTHQSSYLQTGLNLNASTSNASLTAGFSQSDSEVDNDNTQAVGAILGAGRNVNLMAQHDVTLKGTELSAAKNVTLAAGNNIAIVASQNTYSSESDNSHLSAGAGLNFGSDGVGVTANIAMGEGDLDRTGTRYNNSYVTAGESLTLVSGNNTSIEGGNLNGADVTVDVGGNLTLASVQDTGEVDGKRWDVSASVTVGAGASVSASLGYGETDGSQAWVNEQSSIVGSDSVTITTQGHTQVDGGLIANIDENGADQGNLTLATGSLAFTDLQDHDNEQSDYLNVGFSMGDDASSNQQESGSNWSVGGSSYDKDRKQTTLATLGQGAITVGGEQDSPSLEGLNRDVAQAQVITKDEQENTTLYATSTAVDSLANLASDPNAQLQTWGENVTSVADADAWQAVGENGTDALEDTYNATAHVTTNKDLGIGDFGTALDSTHKMTQLKNDLTRTAEGQALLGRLKSDDPEERLAAQSELGNLAQDKFGIDPSEIRFYDGTATTSESLQDTVLADVKGATVIDQSNDEYGNILINVDQTTDGKDMTNTLGHEVYETVTLQENGNNDASQEAIANMVGDQLANRIDQAMGGELANVGTGDFAGSTTVQQGNQYADGVGNAQVDYRRVRLSEAQTLDRVRNVIQGNDSLNTEEKQVAQAQINALACAAVKCSEHIPSDDPDHGLFAKLQEQGELLNDSGVTLGGLIGEENAGEFEHGLMDSFNDTLSKYDEGLTQAGGAVQAVGGAIGIVGGYTIAAGGAAACVPSAGLSCAAIPVGAGISTLGATELNDGVGKMTEAYEHTEGQASMNAFTSENHPGDTNPAMDLAIGAGIVLLETVTAKLGTKFLDTALDGFTKVKKVDGEPFGDVQTLITKDRTGIDNSSRLLEHKKDSDAYINDTRVSKVVDEQTFLEYYAELDHNGNPIVDSNGNYVLREGAAMPEGQYVTFPRDVEGLNNLETKNALTIESIPGHKGYEQYNGTNYRIDFDVENTTTLDIPDRSDYLNDVGGPRTLGGVRQRVTNEIIPLDKCNPTCIKLKGD